MATPSYEHVCWKLDNWHKRLKRAVNAIDKLKRQKARMEKKMAKPVSAVQPSSQPTLSERVDHIVSAIIQGQTFEQASDDCDIPGFLKRTKSDAEAKAEILAEQEAAAKDRARISAEKRKIKAEVKQAELTGKRRKMPIEGKAALAVLRSGSVA